MSKRKRKQADDSSRQWLMRRIETIRERMDAPLPELPPAKRRYQLAANFPTVGKLPPVEPPPGVDGAAWAEAQRNVQFGSAPSTIRKGSDVPSDWTMRRNGFA